MECNNYSKAFLGGEQLGIISIQLSGGGNVGVIVHKDTVPAPENGCSQDDPASVLGQFRPTFSGANLLLVSGRKNICFTEFILSESSMDWKSLTCHKVGRKFCLQTVVGKKYKNIPQMVVINMASDHGRIRKQAL